MHMSCDSYQVLLRVLVPPVRRSWYIQAPLPCKHRHHQDLDCNPTPTRGFPHCDSEYPSRAIINSSKKRDCFKKSPEGSPRDIGLELSDIVRRAFVWEARVQKHKRSMTCLPLQLLFDG